MPIIIYVFKMLLGSVLSYFLPCLALIMEKFILINFYCFAHVVPCENTTGQCLQLLVESGWPAGLFLECACDSVEHCVLPVVCWVWLFASVSLLHTSLLLEGRVSCGFLLFHIYNLIWWLFFFFLHFPPFLSILFLPVFPPPFLSFFSLSLHFCLGYYFILTKNAVFF